MASIAAIILAAGFSRRHASGDKLLRDYRGKPLLLHAVDIAQARGFSSVRLVVQDTKSAVVELVSGRGVNVTVCTEAVQGMGASLAAGVAALDDKTDGAAIFLGDMPEIQPATIDKLIGRFAARPDLIVRPVFDHAPGHPVIFPARLFPDLMRLTGDIGARDVIRGAAIEEISVDDRGVVFDLDDDAAFEAIR